MAFLKFLICANALYDFIFSLIEVKNVDRNDETYLSYHILCTFSLIITVATFIVCWKG